MGHSVRVRLGEVRRVFRLLGEMQEQKTDPAAWQRHMMFGLCGLIGARQGTSLRWAGFTPTGRLKLLDMVGGGWASAAALRMWDDLMRRDNWRADPTLDGSTRLPGRVVTRLREQFISDETWNSIAEIHDVVRAAGVESHLVAFYRRDVPGDASGIALHRTWGDRRFGVHERNVLRLFNVELYRLYRDGKLARFDDDSPALSPRLKQVLDLLLVGDGEKQVARKLGLSKHTVNDYVKALYKRFDVHSRAELMARFVGGQRAAGMA
jgi:DNA-binding CsgD family transcriptional regulator